MTDGMMCLMNAELRDIAQKTGYTFEFLREKLEECDYDLEHIRGVSMEHDW